MQNPNRYMKEKENTVMRRLLLKFIVVVALLPIITLAEIQPTKELLLHASKTYGYHIGQEYTLDEISKKYSSLSNDVLLARSEFDLSFASSFKNLDEYMQKNLGSGWGEIKKTFKKRITDTLKNQRMTKRLAIQFIDTVKKRAKGEIESPVLETLLIFKSGYEENPEQEFLDGYRYTYRNNGVGKSKGVKFTIKVPKTWIAKDGNRPNIVQKFVSHSGANILVLIKNIPLQANEVFSEKDMSEMLTDDNRKLLMPPNSTYINSGKLTLEGLPGLWIQYKTKAGRVRMSIEMESIMYMVIYKNKMIQIQGMNVISVNSDKIENGGIKKYEKLFDLMANSFVIENLYKP